MAANLSKPEIKTSIPLLKHFISAISRLDPRKPEILTRLASFVVKYSASCEGGIITGLDAAIDACEEVIQIAEVSNPILSATLSTLSNALKSRFEILGYEDDLDFAVETAVLAIQFIPCSHLDDSNTADYFGTLFSASHAQFHRLRKLKDANLAVFAAQRALDLTPDGHPDMPRRLNNFGIALQTRFDRFGDLRDLEQAVESKRHAVDLTPNSHPDMPWRLNSLGDTLQARFDRFGEMNDLDQAILSKHHAVFLTPGDHPDRLRLIDNHASALAIRYNRLGELDDLEAALLLKRYCVLYATKRHPNQSMFHHGLGCMLQVRFDRHGELFDLHHAILSKRRAVGYTHDDHPRKPGYLSSLAGTLCVRFDLVNELDDVEEAVVLGRRAVDLSPDNHPDRRMFLDVLGNALEKRFNRLGELNDLEQAIESKRCALDLIPDKHPDKPTYLNNLGNALQTRFDRLGEFSDLEGAIESKRRAVDLTPDDHPDMAQCLNSLGSALHAHFDRFGKLKDLEQAILSKCRAVDLTPDDHPNTSKYIISLVHTLLSHEGLKKQNEINRCLVLLLRAADQQSGPPSIRFSAVKVACSLSWTVIRAQDNNANPGIGSLIPIYERAFQLLPQVAWLGKSVAQRYEELAQIGELVSGAAAAAIACGDHTRAVEWLDQGRSVVWGQLLQLRNPMDELEAYDEAHDSGFSEDLLSVSRELEDTGHDSAKSIGDLISTRIANENRYSSLLAQVRALDGFENFLLPKRYGELVHASSDGPVVIINVHDSRCDALVIIHSHDHPLHVPLPKLSLKLVDSMRVQLLKVLKQAGVRERADARAPSRGSESDRGLHLRPPKRKSDFAEILACLWSTAVHPIIQAIQGELHGKTADSLPHVTWCATGPLAFLPIHAAGEYGSRGKHGLKLSDMAVSSYTTTLSALLRPPLKHIPDLRSPSTNILVVTQPETPGFSPLPGAREEVLNLRRHFSQDAVFHLDSTEATVGAVQQAMSQHGQLIHFACHGIQDIRKPRDSSFILQDGRLKLSEIMSQSNDGAALAFLSACQTATGDETLPDEAVHLAAGMLSAGYRSVIGTMWSIRDCDAPLVADEFYRHLKEDQGEGGGRLRAAYALHDAVKVLRDKVGELDFVRWAPFVHFGL